MGADIAGWSLVFEGYDPSREGIREALCTLGNGYFATRAAATWAKADGTAYPGTYLAGGYDRLLTEIAGRTIENEELVNFPNWLALDVRIGDQDWFDIKTTTLLSYRQELDLKRGLLVRTLRFEDVHGQRTSLREERLVSMADMHIGALELSLTAEDWSGRVTVRSAVDGRVAVETGALVSALGGLDGLVFTAGIGEHASAILSSVCAWLDWFGLWLDENANAASAGRISASDNAIEVLVIPTDEEAVIARHTQAIVWPQIA